LASFRILTFGCKVNQCDSQIIRETLASWGLTDTSREAASPKAAEGCAAGFESAHREPDLVVFNTCTVTGVADSKFRKALRRINRENPRSLTAVTGCFADKMALFPEQPPEADLVFKMRDFSALADFLRRSGIVDVKATASASTQTYFAEHTRAFLKIQDGCDCYCAYCIVPVVRPRLWSDKPEKVVAAISELSEKRYSEVVLTGIHLGFYGRDSGRSMLADLMRRIEAECDISRVRLSSIEINEVSDEMLELMAGSEKFCRHLHLPLQSGDDEILRKMGRRYSSAFFVDRIEEIRGKIPDIGITTDVIVGFPGETDGQFARTMELVKNIGFTKTHVFRYSPRPGTKAAKMKPRVTPDVVSSRARRLIGLGEEAAMRFRERFVGRTLDVLAESRGDNGNSCTGFSSNYIKIKVLDPSQGSLNQILPVLITEAGGPAGIATGRLA